MFCKHCGAPVSDGAKFCPKCGGALTSVPEAPKAEAPKAEAPKPTPPPQAPKPQPAPQPEPVQPDYTPEPEPEVEEGPKKPYMSLKEVFAGTKITADTSGISKSKLIIAAVLVLVLVIVGLCSR